MQNLIPFEERIVELCSSMNLHLVYIQESDLNSQLVKTLDQVYVKDDKVLFFVELKEVDEKSIPMIVDLMSLRLRKAERRIKSWLQQHIENLKNYEVLVFNGKPSRTNPSYNLSVSKQDGVHVIIDPKHENRIAPYLRQHAGSHQIKYLSLGDFNGEDLGTM